MCFVNVVVLIKEQPVNGKKSVFGSLNHSVKVITIDSAQSDPIKRRALYLL